MGPGGGGGIVSKIGGTGGNNGYQFVINNTGPRLESHFNALGEGWPSNTTNGIINISIGQWYHVAWTYDNNESRLYLNGILVASETVGAKSVIDSSSSLRISSDDNNNVFFNGLIDDVAIYNRTLSESEIQAHRDGFVVANAFNDFSASTNQNGDWSYGDTDTLGGVFNLFTQTDNILNIAGVPAWTRSTVDLDASVAKNETGTDILVDGNLVIPSTNYLHLHPSFSGKFVVARWIAPNSSTFMIDSEFLGLRTEPGPLPTTDVHVLHNNIPIFDGLINISGNDNSESFFTTMSINSGDIIDFAIGTGNGNWSFDSTGLSVTISDTVSQECVQPPAGLVSWWAGEGDANDLIGTNHGTLQGNVTFTSGVVGQAFSFDGSSGFVSIPGSSTLDLTNEITLEFWFNYSDANVIRGLIAKRAGPGGSANYGVNAVGSSPFGFELGIGLFYNDPTVTGGDDFDAVGSTFEASRVPLPSPSQFHHFAGTYKQVDPTHIELKVFINGQLVKTKSIPGNLGNTLNDAPITIGASWAGGEVFKGIIDEVGIYNRALSASEIQTIFNAGSAGKCKDGNEVPIIGNTIQLPATNEFSLEQFTQATFMIDLVNKDSVSHTATVEVLNPDENLSVTLDQAGLISLAAGETQILLLNTDATMALPGTYNVQIKVINDDGAIIYSNVRIIVTAQGTGDLPDLTLTSRDIVFSQLNPEVGDTVTISSIIQNKGTAAASNVAVQFFDSDTYLGEVALTNIEPDAFNIASLPVTLSTEGVHFIRVVVDPLDVIMELDVSNNEASQLIQVGSSADVTGNILVTGSLPATVTQNQLFTVSGHAVYEIIVNGLRNVDNVVKGGAVQVTVQEAIEGGQEWLYGDINTNVSGDFSKLLQAPSALGDYRIILMVTDQTFTGQRELTFTVVEPSPPPPPPTSSGSGFWSSTGEGGTLTWTWTEPPVNEPVPQDDVFVFSEDIVFSNDNPALGEEITIFATIHYWANSSDLFAENVPINFYVAFPGFPKIKIGETVIDRLTIGEPHFGTVQVFTPWMNQADGIYIVEVEIDPGYVEANVNNNAATRAIIVGELTVGMGAVTGHVLDPSGAVEGVSIELLDLNGNIIATTLTDNTGGYLFQDIAVGQKQVRILTPVGYIVDAETKTTDVITGNITVVNFNLALQSPPVANAGNNVTIDSSQQLSTTLKGTASDPDGNLLTYKWLEGTTELLASTPVVGGSAPLDLSLLLPLGIGAHTLTLEVSDGLTTATDDMILTIENSPPVVAPSGGGTFQLGYNITLSGNVADFDGDGITYRWFEGITDFTASFIGTIAGGTPVVLPDFIIIGGLPLGNHVITLEANDGTNPPVSYNISIDVIDTTAPAISATVSPGILWPPNHKMVDVIIQATATDNSGSVTLTASVSGSEPPDTDGDGNTIPDYTTPVIDQTTGQITLQLRAERKGQGTGRTYTITVTATDGSGSSSDAVVEVVAPHDKGKK